MSNRRLLTALCLPLFISACSIEGPESLEDLDEQSPGEEASEGAPAQPLTLSDLIRKTKLGFREEGDSVAAGDATHRVELYGARIELTPFLPGVSDEPGQTPATPAIPGATLGLETVELARGAVDLLDEPGTPELEQDGSVTIPRGPVDEHLANTEVGVEQSWTLHQAPGGEGDLVVRIQVDGTQGYVAQTDSGLHFEDPLSGLGVSYGVATWIDADGAETTVMPTFEDGQIVIRIPSEVVDASAFPVLLDPIVSAENGIDNPVLGGAPGYQDNPAIAFGANEGFAVWEDWRLGVPAIYGARLSKSGHVLDPSGLLLASGGTSADVAWDGTSYFVGWSNGASILVRRFAPTGAPLEEPIPISALESYGSVDLAVASSGSKNYVAVRKDGAVWLGATGKDGSVAWYASAILVASLGTEQVDITCAQAGLCVLAADTSEGDLALRSWDDSGSDNPSALLAGLVQRTVYGANGAHLAARASDVVLASSRWGTYQALIIEPNGGISNGFDTGESGSPTGVACGLDDCVVVGPTRFIGLDPETGFSWVSETSPELHPADIAFDGADFITVGRGSGGPLYNEVYSQRISADGAWTNPRLLSTTALNTEVSPDVACDADQCLVVWQDTRDDEDRIYGAFTTKAGSPLTGSAIGLGCTEGGCTAARNPAVVHAGGRFVTAYECTYGFQSLCFTSVQGDGAVVYRDEPAQRSYARRPRLAAGPNGQVLAVAQVGLEQGGRDVLAVRVDAEAGLLNDTWVSSWTEDQLAPTVAYDGTGFVVAWEDWRRGVAFGPDIMAARVSVAGAVLDQQAIQVSMKNTAEARPDIASDGAGSVLVTWEDNRGGSWDIYGARLAGATVTDAAGLSFGTPGTSQQRNPVIAWNGVNYQVAWEDDRNGTGDLYGRQITTAGVMSGGAFGIVTGSTASTQPALAATGAGSALVVYQRFVPSLDQTRVRAKAITP